MGSISDYDYSRLQGKVNTKKWKINKFFRFFFGACFCQILPIFLEGANVLYLFTQMKKDYRLYLFNQMKLEETGGGAFRAGFFWEWKKMVFLEN